MPESESARNSGHASNRIIIHCDLDAFFASVETLHLDLDENIPLIIGSDPLSGKGRGIVSTCNYTAREFGIRSAMPISEAWRRCPGPPQGVAMYCRGRFNLYRRASRMVMQILKEHCDVFEKAGIDEAYLDVTDRCDADWDVASSLARNLQQKLNSELSLSTSFGIAPTRITAKMASEENKPQGIFRVLPSEVSNFFIDRSVHEVPGIGPATATRLAEWGIRTMDEAHAQGALALSSMLGERLGSWLVAVVEGETSNAVSPIRTRRSIGKEHTFARDVSDAQVVLRRLHELVRTVCERLHELGAAGRLLEVKLRYRGFETLNHGKSISVAMDDLEVFEHISTRLLLEMYDQSRPVRLIGFRVAQLESHLDRQSTLASVVEEE